MAAAPRPVRHPPTPWHGWRVVAGACLVLMTGFGAIYSYAAFADEIAAEFGVARASVTLVYALAGGSCFLVSALSGPLADRIGARVPALAGMLLVGLGLMVSAAATSLAEVLAGYGLLIGLGTGFAYVPAMAAVQQHFRAHRGLASGIAASGIGIGTALVPPAAQALLAFGDWRLAFAVCGVLAALAGAAGALLLDGPTPRAAPSPAGGALAGLAAPPRGLSARLRSRGFALAWAGTLLASIPATLPHALLVATARDLGVPGPEALGLLGLIGLGTIAGRFLLAALADLAGRRLTFLACTGGMAGSLLAWAAAGDTASLQGFALLFGALQGGFVALLPAFVADSFGAAALGGVLGALYTSRGIALLAAPPALALGIAALAGHGLPVAAAAALGGLGTLLLAGVPRRGPAGERRR